MNLGLIFNIQRFCVNDGPGIRTTVFFKGCPLNCIWCQNPEGRKFELEKMETNPNKYFSYNFKDDNGTIGKKMSVDSIIKIIMKDYMFYEESNGGVTFSGGEPMSQVDFLLDLLKCCKTNNIHTAVDTCGYVQFKRFEKILPFTDLFLYDIKIMDENDSLKYTGVSNKLILENLKQLSLTDKNIFLRIPLIPDITDTDKNVKDIIKFISELSEGSFGKKIKQISLLPFNEVSKSKYKKFNAEYDLKMFKSQSEEKLKELTNKFVSKGFEVKLRG
ncbi:MAG TPA: glycyl-radical enzyme activating protein [Ignavibacteriaceae bacterium]|nr:glycyl-radical enzyme activating protein [Ignavibacteriaceae bacterium]